LAPRHPNRFDGVAKLLKRGGVEFVLRSADLAATSTTAVVLVDSVGELLALYAAADLAFVGGSLVPVGGHNLLEPAALGLPVLTGPSSFNGQQMAHTLLHQGAALQVGSAEELGKTLQQLFADPDRRRRIGALGRRTVEFNRGSVARLIELIGPMLKAGPTLEDSPQARS
jgi:3-deoxy-D-manno-octulosonic-acid transferase